MRTLVVFLCMIASCFSGVKAINDYVIDFESEQTSPKHLSSAGWLYENSLQLIENPLSAGINTSSNVLTFEAQEGIEWWGGALVEIQETTATETLRYLYLKVLAEDSFSTKFMVGLFGGTQGNYTDLNTTLHATRLTSMDTEWKEFCFVIEPGVKFSSIRIQPGHFGAFYIDDIRLSDEAPVIPEIESFSLDFEGGKHIGRWSKNSDEGACYKAPVAEDPFTNDLFGNKSDSCMRVWIKQGTWDKYGGGRFENVYGTTTESSRYLHVRYFFKSNEDAHNGDKPLRIFVDNTDNSFESEPLAYNQWNDVTIDLGVGTLVKYLVFNIDGWWVSLGLDDIQLDGDPNERADLETGINDPKANFGTDKNPLCSAVDGGIMLSKVQEETLVEIFSISGIVVEQRIITSSQKIALPKGIYAVKTTNKAATNSTKLIVK